MDITEAASSGDRLKGLQALRDVIAARIAESESARDVAALSGQMTQILKQIEDLDKASGAKKSKVDELAERRNKRRRPVKDGAARESS